MREQSLKEAARREREERVILRAAVLLSRHPSYLGETPEGKALRITRSELLALVREEER
jgi:hypothetical protein